MAGPTTLFQTGIHSARPAATSGCVLYWCTTHSIMYRSDGAAWATLQDLSAIGSSASSLTAGKVTRTSGDVSTASATFVDVTGASITITTGARRVMLGFTASAYLNNAAGSFAFDFTVDGSRVGADFGLCIINQHATASEAVPVTMTFLTDALSAGSHTFKVQFRVASASHTATINAASAGSAYSFSAVELYAA